MKRKIFDIETPVRCGVIALAVLVVGLSAPRSAFAKTADLEVAIAYSCSGGDKLTLFAREPAGEEKEYEEVSVKGSIPSAKDVETIFDATAEEIDAAIVESVEVLFVIGQGCLAYRPSMTDNIFYAQKINQFLLTYVGVLASKYPKLEEADFSFYMPRFDLLVTDMLKSQLPAVDSEFVPAKRRHVKKKHPLIAERGFLN